jgi:hypothetical protein
MTRVDEEQAARILGNSCKKGLETRLARKLQRRFFRVSSERGAALLQHLHPREADTLIVTGAESVRVGNHHGGSRS